MKKLILALTIAIASWTVSLAQGAGSEVKRVYVELIGQGQLFSSKVKVTIDFGQQSKFWTGFSDQRLVDENGKEIKFNSMIDAMNYMGQFGWVFAQAYVTQSGGTRDMSIDSTVHWILYKDVTDYNQIREGFTTKEQYKNQH